MPPWAISVTTRYRPTMMAGDAVVRESEDIGSRHGVVDEFGTQTKRSPSSDYTDRGLGRWFDLTYAHGSALVSELEAARGRHETAPRKPPPAVAAARASLSGARGRQRPRDARVSAARAARVVPPRIPG